MHTKKFLATWWTYLALQISAFPPDDLSLLNRSFGTFEEWFPTPLLEADLRD